MFTWTALQRVMELAPNLVGEEQRRFAEDLQKEWGIIEQSNPDNAILSIKDVEYVYDKLCERLNLVK